MPEMNPAGLGHRAASPPWSPFRWDLGDMPVSHRAYLGFLDLASSRVTTGLASEAPGQLEASEEEQ